MFVNRAAMLVAALSFVRRICTRPELLYGASWTYFRSVRQLHATLDRFLEFYNRRRPHEGYRGKGRTSATLFSTRAPHDRGRPPLREGAAGPKLVKEPVNSLSASGSVPRTSEPDHSRTLIWAFQCAIPGKGKRGRWRERRARRGNG